MLQSRVTIMGLGRHGGGVAVARYFALSGAEVTITDLADEQALASSLAQLAGAPIRHWRLGGHEEADFVNAELVVANPAVRPDHPLLRLACRSGARITSETELFLAACRAPVIAVTGSLGKSTTSAMISAVLAADGRCVWLGGNIGRSLLAEVDEIAPSDWVVLEVSSFQLSHLPVSTGKANVQGTALRPPRVAVVTNCLPNHLDWHRDFDEYRAAKQRLLALQLADSVTVLSDADPEVDRWAPLVRGRRQPLPEDEAIPPLPVSGRHNRVNARCAAAAALAADCSWEAIERGLGAFRGLPHRLQFVAEVRGRRFYDDSKATTPEAVIAALAAIEGPIWLLAGGQNKGLALGQLGKTIANRVTGACFFGASAPMLLAAAQAAVRPALAGREALSSTANMREALQWCWARSRGGDVILLSPACASFDQFRDYEERGARYSEMVDELAHASQSARASAL